MKHKTNHQDDELLNGKKSKEMKTSYNLEDEPQPGPSNSHSMRDFPPSFDSSDSDSEDDDYDREPMKREKSMTIDKVALSLSYLK